MNKKENNERKTDMLTKTKKQDHRAVLARKYTM